MKTFAHDPFVKIAHKSLAYILVFCVVNMPVWAISGGALVQGELQTLTNSLVELNSSRAVINWNDFDTTAGQSITFNGPGSFAVLNRVIAGGATSFDGNLFGGQGHILLINPQGIVFGPNASISAARFTASTMHLVDDENFSDFMSGSNTFEFAKGGADPAAQIALLAGSSVTAERVELLAQKITNAGTITTGPGGIVAMAAGDRILLGESGSNIIVEMDSATGVVADIDTDFGTIAGGPAGNITNNGEITAAGGHVVLAAGDIFSVLNEERAVKVHWGTGTVNQNGKIDVSATTGNGGVISLTAGTATTLGDTSETYANAGTDGDSGLVSVHSKGDTELISGAKIEAKGGYFETPLESDPEYDDGIPENDIAIVNIIQENSVEIIGNTIKFDNELDTINATTTNPDKKGKIYFEADSLTIADVLPDDHTNMILAGYIEGISAEYMEDYPGVDIELAGLSEITVGAFAFDDSLGGALADGIINGGSGDITLRTLLIGGSIDLTPRNALGNVLPIDPIDIETVVGKSNPDFLRPYDAGNIFMVAGTGGITTGNLLSYVAGGQNLPYEPGRIRLLTAKNEVTGESGDISTETLYVEGGGIAEIAVIASGDLTVDGAVNAITHETSEEDKTIGFSRICLISGDGTVLVDTGDINVDNATKNNLSTSNRISIDVQGKFVSAGQIKISAKEDIIVRNADTDQAIFIDTFSSQSPNSEPDPDNFPYAAGSRLCVEAGGDIIFDQGEGVDEVIYDAATNTDIPIFIKANVSGGGSGVTFEDASTQGTLENIDPETGDAEMIERITLHINEFDDCINCPAPPVLILNIDAVDDTAIQHMNLDLDTLSTLLNGGVNISVIGNDSSSNGITIVDYTNPVLSGTDLELGTLTFYKEDTLVDDVLYPAGSFVYVPEGGFAQDTVEFEYTIMNFDEEYNLVVTDTAVVTLQYTNELPGGDSWLGNEVPMDTTGETRTLADGINNFADTADTVDGIDYTDGIQEIVILDPPSDQDFNKSFGGDLTYNGTDNEYDEDASYTYDSTAMGLPGYVGDDVDDFAVYGGTEQGITDNADDRFNVGLWDGQYDYEIVLEGDTAPENYDLVYTSTEDGYSVYKGMVYGDGTISLDIDNELPEGDSWLGTTQMDTAVTDASLATNGFSSDVIDIEIDSISSSDYNKSFGGTLTYDGTDYDYDPTTMGLPGYVGDTGTVEDDFDNAGYVIDDNADDRFNVNLWDGQYDYAFEQVDGVWVVDTENTTKVYGEGTISVDIINELPEGDSWLGTTQMDTAVTDASLATNGFSSDVIDVEIDSISSSDYNKSFGGTLTYDGTDYDYDPTTMGLPGYVGDTGTVEDDFDNAGYVIDDNADDRFNVNLWDGQYDYAFEQVDGVWVVDTENTTKVYGEGTISVDIINELPEGDSWLGTTQMDTAVTDASLATNGFSSDVIDVEIDSISSSDYNKSFGGTLTYDGTDYDYDPTTMGLPGYVGDTGTVEDDFDNAGYVIDDNADDRFNVNLWDGQYDYAFEQVDGVWVVDTENTTKVYGEGTISVDIINELPEGDSWLGTTQMDTAVTDASLATNGFSSDVIDVEIDSISSSDYNKSFGGTLTYDGTDYDYDPTTMGLPGYVGDTGTVEDDFDNAGYVIDDNADDRFNVNLWDGQYDYAFEQVDGVWVVDTENTTKVYGEGTISVDIINELPEGDAGFGQIHMDSQDVTQTLQNGFGDDITIEAATYTDGSVIDNYGTRTDSFSGTLAYNGDGTWTYSAPKSDLPGFVGDSVDDFAAYSQETDGIDTHADNLFTVNLSNGQNDYLWLDPSAETPSGYEDLGVFDGYKVVKMAVFSEGTGTVSVDITNVLPTIDENTTIEHMNEDILNQLFATDQLDSNPIVELDALTPLDGSGNPTVTYTTDFGIDVTVTQNPDGSLAYTYEPADGYVDEDSFDVTVSDGQRDYVFTDDGYSSDDPVTVSGTVSLEYTNILPAGNGDLGTTESGTPKTVPQIGDDPVLVFDFPDLPQQDIDDVLSIPDGTYTGSAGGSLVFLNGEWTYTPDAGFVGTETFEIDVWDGQRDYANIEEWTPVYGLGTVTVTVTELPPPPPPTPTPTPDPVLVLAPVAPLADYEIPRLVGCPAEMEAAANELATNSDQLQLLIANAMATNPNLQPCDACASLLTAATVLKQMDNQHIAALAQIFNSQAPIDAPFTPEVSASVATAFANFREMETELAIMTAEQYEQYQQYALADELVEAFVSYVAVLENDLKLPVGDAMALVMDKYGEAVEAIGNPNISVYLIEQMEAVGVASELIVASAD